MHKQQRRINLPGADAILQEVDINQKSDEPSPAYFVSNIHLLTEGGHLLQPLKTREKAVTRTAARHSRL
jgi:hypothetical protein